MFFYLYAVIELLAIFLDSGIIPTSNAVYTWFAAIYTGLVAAAYACLLINGFVGFQFAEDGTPLSLWVRSPSSFLLRLRRVLILPNSSFVSHASLSSPSPSSMLSSSAGTSLKKCGRPWQHDNFIDAAARTGMGRWRLMGYECSLRAEA